MPREEAEVLYEEDRQLGEALGDRHHLAALALGYVVSEIGEVTRYASGAKRVLPLVEEVEDPSSWRCR
jgi:hypothetical protein